MGYQSWIILCQSCSCQMTVVVLIIHSRCEDRRAHTFPKDISLKVNVIAWLGLELALLWRRSPARLPHLELGVILWASLVEYFIRVLLGLFFISYFVLYIVSFANQLSEVGLVWFCFFVLMAYQPSWVKSQSEIFFFFLLKILVRTVGHRKAKTYQVGLNEDRLW